MAFISLGGVKLRPDCSGALIWDDARTIIVADLHFEKASSFARRGQPLPPYDTAATLAALDEVIARTQPLRVVCLGDSFHDPIAADEMPTAFRAQLADLMAGRTWIWVAGNHDRAIPGWLGGERVDELTLGEIAFRHEAGAGSGPEVSGHFHPKATVSARGRMLTRPCFIYDESRVILPAFGAFTGGLNITDRAIASRFPGAFGVALLGRRALHWFASAAIC